MLNAHCVPIGQPAALGVDKRVATMNRVLLFAECKINPRPDGPLDFPRPDGGGGC